VRVRRARILAHPFGARPYTTDERRTLMKLRTLALPAIGLITALVLVGCAGNQDDTTGDMPGMSHGSSSPSEEAETSADFNDADVAFAMNMIMHHQQAIEMADIVLEKEVVGQDVVDLAQDIKDAQQPEIDLMSEWLDDWVQTSPDMDGMDHNGMMMSEDDMAELEAAADAEAGRLFLEQMIEHHQGAIDMAEQEISDGQDPDAIALAEKIVEDQTAEITVMQELLQNG
jgi:uncharacterized protein (DUF305 family)